MLELYQFELSAYCEKVRLILDYKGLAYKKRDVVPGVGQLDLFRLSGQRQVPVLKDGDTYIADSTEIAFYLDRKYPEKPIIPTDPLQRGQCLLIEEWADESLGLKGRTAFLGAFAQNQNFRTAFLPRETPDFMRLFYLVGDQPTLADLAVAGLSVLLQFPQGSYLNLPRELQGKGIPGLADNSAYEGFFAWRDRLYSQYRQTITPGSSTPPIDSPTSIQIE